MGMAGFLSDNALPRDVLELKQAAREFVTKRILPFEPEISRTGIVPDDIARDLRQLGYYGLTISPKYDGQGVDHLTYCAILEELTRSPKPVWNLVNVCNGIAARVLERFGSEHHRDRFLRGIATGDVVPSIAVTEPGAGSDVQSLQTRARQVGGGWLITGTKHFISYATEADCLFVLARTGSAEDGRKSFTFFLVERGNPGLHVAGIQETMAGPPYDQAELVFDDCFVADDDVLGHVGSGLKAVFATFVGERISMSIGALGAAQRALELAVGHARNREAFGHRISEFQAVAHPLADSVTELAAARALTYAVARRVDDGTVAPHEAAMVKLYCAEMAGRVADRCLQVFGGSGYMMESPISRIYRDVRVLRISGGTSEIQRNIIGQALLGGD
jgi:alkylation response protein AidB-like acyl-CoA dehydrogenase